jgi:catalase
MAGKRISEKEMQERVMEAYELRYESDKPIRQEDWVRLCHTKYGDKSEQQYCQYFTQARDIWENGLQNKLEQMLEPAANQLRELLDDPNPSIRQRAIDQIMKYTGRDIERKLIKAEINNITIGFGE